MDTPLATPPQVSNSAVQNSVKPTNKLFEKISILSIILLVLSIILPFIIGGSLYYSSISLSLFTIALAGIGLGLITFLASILGIRSKIKVKLAIGSLILATIITVFYIFLLVGSFQLQKDKTVISKQTYEVNQGNGQKTKVTNYNVVPQKHKTYSNACFSSTIPDPSTIYEKDCHTVITFEGTTIPYVVVTATVDLKSTDSKTDINKAIPILKELLKNDERFQIEGVKIGEETINGNKFYVASWSDQLYDNKLYFIDQPLTTNYTYEGKRIKYFTFKGLAGDPNRDPFSKEFKTFMENFKFK